MMASQQQVPPQQQDRQPGIEAEMTPEPQVIRESYRGSGKLDGKVAIVTGGDSGIGRAVAVHFAREGADVAILYLDEHQDAEKTKAMVEAEGKRCLTIGGDVGSEDFCRQAVEKVVSEFQHIDVLVNNAAEQHEAKDFTDITEEQLTRTFRTNIFGYFFMTKEVLPHLKEEAAIVNSTSVTAYKGNPMLIDYASTKGAIVAFTRSLAMKLVEQGIRVNGVAPGPIWTPLIPASFEPDRVAEHGSSAPMGRAGQPSEVAPCYVFLASEDGSYISGQVLHPNGGTVVNG
jgi:NAD(P)-dependent dehydrogenase (short-subunit alcohol dehydrogenase family)